MMLLHIAFFFPNVDDKVCTEPSITTWAYLTFSPLSCNASMTVRLRYGVLIPSHHFKFVAVSLKSIQVFNVNTLS